MRTQLVQLSSPRFTLIATRACRLDIHLDRKYTWADVASRFLFLGLMTGKGGIAACFREMADSLDGRVMLRLEHSGEQSQANILSLSNR